MKASFNLLHSLKVGRVYYVKYFIFRAVVLHGYFPIDRRVLMPYKRLNHLHSGKGFEESSKLPSYYGKASFAERAPSWLYLN